MRVARGIGGGPSASSGGIVLNRHRRSTSPSKRSERSWATTPPRSPAQATTCVVPEPAEQLRHVLRVGGHVVAVVGRQRRVAEPAQVGSDHLEAGCGERLDVALPDAARLGPAVDQQQRLAALARAVVGQRASSSATVPLQPHGGPLRPQDDRGQMAARLGRRAHLGGEQRARRAPQGLRARDAPVPLGRAAHRPPQELRARRRGRPLLAPRRLSRAAPDGLRRVRPARPRTTRSTRASTRASRPRLRSPSSSASCATGASRSTGRASSAPTSRASTAGPSGSSCACSSAASPTARRRPSSGAPTTPPCSPTSR